MLQMKNKIHPIYKILLIVMGLGGLYFYYKYIRGFYDTVIIDDLSKNESYLGDEPSNEKSYSYKHIKIKGELYGETTLKIISIWTNPQHTEHGLFRDTLFLNFKKQGVLDTLIVNKYCDYAIQSELQNIPKPNTKGYLKAKIHLGGFL
jgi:hypothetical protein